MMQFTDLSLGEPILKALAAADYDAPTPIQMQAIPHILGGRDMLGLAQTGTGKTAAFALPILEKLAAADRRTPPRTCRVLVLSPTRELASQIEASFRTYGRYLNVSVAAVYGGVAQSPQVKALARGLDVLVATPGRLLDHMGTGALRLDGVETFVLDEADRMLDMGFIHDIRRIVRALPRQRQNLFFSATMPREIAGLADDLLRDPIEVKVTPAATTVERVAQHVIFVDGPGKRGLAVEVLSDPAVERALVFARTKRGVDRVVRQLAGAGIDAAAIHGDKSQNQRERALAAFRTGRTRVLVATDIAARGIDVDDVSHVVNFDLPNVPEVYVHRIGRTARAGATGIAISFCSGDERDYLRDIERLIRQRIPVRHHAAASHAAEESPSSDHREPRDRARRHAPPPAAGHEPRREGHRARKRRARAMPRPERNGHALSGIPFLEGVSAGGGGQAASTARGRRRFR
ncbi:MAG: DEAD/DEAH box helicase [Alphaproteobacteria bacterium]